MPNRLQHQLQKAAKVLCERSNSWFLIYFYCSTFLINQAVEHSNKDINDHLKYRSKLFIQIL
jgi:hypothetical protein